MEYEVSKLCDKLSIKRSNQSIVWITLYLLGITVLGTVIVKYTYHLGYGSKTTDSSDDKPSESLSWGMAFFIIVTLAITRTITIEFMNYLRIIYNRISKHVKKIV